MADQLFTDGDVKTIDGNELECVAVAYRETDGEKHNFVYSFQLKSELDVQREAEAKAQEEQARVAETQDINNADAPVEPETPVASQPVEETQYVK